ncbi:MAG TPA: hypothetical protein VFB03_00180 [Candidatus Saccharimonadales bacterium]|nr:hypothetical protein [Candidatus Saccharimonadales bacterium]
MATICPTITAYSEGDYRKEIEKIVHIAHRIQIDLTDGIFTKQKTVSPEQAWWPVGFTADFHLMYKNPITAVQKILHHKPNLIIVHAESNGDFSQVVGLCKHHSVKLGIALLPDTPAETIISRLDEIDHVLIFSGNLGYQGNSHADLLLLDKVKLLKREKPAVEIGWDGGVNDQNISQLVFGGVDVINVGSFIQEADSPQKAYKILERIAEETGTT